MERRIVISFRAAGGAGRNFLERARALEARARAYGAVVVAWDASRVTFAFEGAALAEALLLATTPGEDALQDEPPWSVAFAQGDLRLLAEDGSRGDLAWGPPLVASSLLSAVARPGELLCETTVRALRSGELLTVGSRVAREGAQRVRGMRLDPRTPWRAQAVEQLAHLRVPRLIGEPPSATGLVPGALRVLRADPGSGGTRTLTELAATVPRALIVSPSGSGLEPLGALRRAFARVIGRELGPKLLDMAEALEALLAGGAVPRDVAARLISAFLWPRSEGQAGLLLIDDARHVDLASLETCARAAQAGGVTFAVVARLDATGNLPPALSPLESRGRTEMPIARLGAQEAQALAGACTNDALDATARRRWARLSGGVPLAVVSAIEYGIVTGDITWTKEGAATPRSRAAGRGKARTAADWILLRAREEGRAARTVLCLIALLGGEAKVTRLVRILEAASEAIAVEVVLEELIRGRWLVDTQEDWVGLPSRTHAEALAGLLEDEPRRALHRAASEVVAAEEGAFGRAEAGWHAAQAGDGARAAQLFVAAARATVDAGFQESGTQLIGFARRADPSCEGSTLELLEAAFAGTAPVASGIL